MSLFDHRRRLGQAIWVYLLYSASAENSEKTWLPVAQGRLVGDIEAAYLLHVTEGTARRWRKALERAGLVRTIRGRKVFLAFIRNPEAVFTQPAETQPAGQPEQEPDRASRWIQ